MCSEMTRTPTMSVGCVAGVLCYYSKQPLHVDTWYMYVCGRCLNMLREETDYHMYVETS